MAVRIEEIDTRLAAERLLEELYQYYVPLYAEDLPDDPPIPWERQLADWRNLPEKEHVPRWALRQDGEIVAVGVAAFDLEQNLENGFARIHVRPDLRGRGLGRSIARPILDLLADNGRRRLATTVTDGSPVEALVERLGLRSAYQDQRSRLTVGQVDLDLMSRWIDRAGERASDYDLVYLVAPFPEEVVKRYCDLQFQMNTAPREEFEEEDEILTPTQWRDTEQKAKAAQTVLNTYVAVHRTSGEFVGSTTVQTDLLQPEQAWQWETVVHPDHRNKGLGRWLKAALLLRLRDQYPNLERIDTWNAGSNQPMLDINHAMGFRTVLVQNVWQGDLNTVRDGLS